MMLPTPIAFKSAARVAQREAFQSGRTARLTKTLLSLAGARGGETPAVVAATTSEQKLRRRRRLWLRIALASLQRAGPGVVRAGVQAREGNGAPAPAARGCTKMTTTVSQRVQYSHDYTTHAAKRPGLAQPSNTTVPPPPRPPPNFLRSREGQYILYRSRVFARGVAGHLLASAERRRTTAGPRAHSSAQAVHAVGKVALGGSSSGREA
jgi:hypothetical protein